MGQKDLRLMQQDKERNRKIRAVVSDMDGSFLNGSGRVSKGNFQAVEKLQDAGIRFLVCTGPALKKRENHWRRQDCPVI